MRDSDYIDSIGYYDWYERHHVRVPGDKNGGDQRLVLFRNHKYRLLGDWGNACVYFLREVPAQYKLRRDQQAQLGHQWNLEFGLWVAFYQLLHAKPKHLFTGVSVIHRTPDLRLGTAPEVLEIRQQKLRSSSDHNRDCNLRRKCQFYLLRNLHVFAPIRARISEAHQRANGESIKDQLFELRKDHCRPEPRRQKKDRRPVLKRIDPRGPRAPGLW
jgi:hypothetical protein